MIGGCLGSCRADLSNLAHGSQVVLAQLHLIFQIFSSKPRLRLREKFFFPSFGARDSCLRCFFVAGVVTLKE